MEKQKSLIEDSDSPAQNAIIVQKPDGAIEIAQDNSPRIVMGMVVCDTMKQVMSMAKHYIRAGLVPRGLEGRTTAETESRVAVAVEYGMNIGLTPLQSLSSVLVVNNRPCIWGDSLMSLVVSHKAYGGQEVSWEGEGDERTVNFTVFRIVMGQKTPYKWSFSVKDAKRAGLWGRSGPWSSYPERMMLYRARAFALRDAFPDALRGAGLAEEHEGHTSEDAETAALNERLMSNQ